MLKTPLRVIVFGAGMVGENLFEAFRRGGSDVEWSKDRIATEADIEKILAGIRLAHISSGCIYQGSNAGAGFNETDKPNFDDSFYSFTKYVAERLISHKSKISQERWERDAFYGGCGAIGCKRLRRVD